MKFQVLDIIPHLKNPLFGETQFGETQFGETQFGETPSGEIVSAADRLHQVVQTAKRAEELGYDSFSVGERHAGEFISSSPTTVLAAISAVTSKIRLQSGVTVLSVLDPVRVAEDYATIDQLSRGRLELVIGKGNEVLQYPLFGLDLADQWELLAEKYGLLRRLWREENVTWSGRFRTPLAATTTTPRPFAGAPRVWHGSATTLTSAALAAKWGDPLFTANAIQPRENYKVLIDHYRDEYERHGHDPRYRYLGSGSGAGGVFLADTTQEAKRQFGPVYEALTAARNVPGNNSPFRNIDQAVAEGPALVGSPQQVIDKILSYHNLYGHDLQSISLPTTLPFEQQLEILERFALEVIPAVRAAAPTSLWEPSDPYGGRPEAAGATESDAAACITGDHTGGSGDHSKYRSENAHVHAH
jgi:alkanesulfonate monooxygenase SsuD/methylene tetrahydromethanopterin reductase-like flavin-dependent oxidoreductase (luciferase family)